jgi:hypothetical protein
MFVQMHPAILLYHYLLESLSLGITISWTAQRKKSPKNLAQPIKMKWLIHQQLTVNRRQSIQHQHGPAKA